jgi:hypothetical protein
MVLADQRSGRLCSAVMENAKRLGAGAVMELGVAVAATWPVDPQKSAGAPKVGISSNEAQASAWAQIAEESEFPTEYEGTASPEADQASEAIQEQIWEHIVATNDPRLFGLLHLLGQASLCMERVLWPEDYERMIREVQEALREANDRNAKLYIHQEVMQARIDRTRDKPC